MTLPIPVNNPKILLVINEECEEIKKIMKETADEVIKKSSDEAKIALKISADAFIEETVPLVTLPSKISVEQSSPESLTPIINKSIDTYVETVSKKIVHRSIDRFVDSGMKQAVDSSSNTSVETTQSILSRTYNYIQSWFV